MTHIQRVHFELMQRLPVRTVAAKARYAVTSSSNAVRPTAIKRRSDIVQETLALRVRIMALVRDGMTDAEISRELGVSAVTVGSHRRGDLACLKWKEEA